MPALWEEIELDAKQFADIDRHAMIGDEDWPQRMTSLCNRFTAAAIRYFSRADAVQAQTWLREGRLELEMGRPA
jgi:hypothetical protein